MSNKKILISIFIGCVLTLLLACGKKSSGTGAVAVPSVPPVVPPVVGSDDVDFWLTTVDQSALLAKQTTVLSFGTVVNANLFVDVDSTQAYQIIDGFGYSLTGGSTCVINRLPAAEKANLLAELFGNNANSIGISYLRISMGASDLDATVFSYDDIPAGQTDLTLANFILIPEGRPDSITKGYFADQSSHKDFGYAMEPAGMDER